MILGFYHGLTALGAPLLGWNERRRMARSGVARARWPERFGRAGAVRPEGLLVWINAVSVGETLSVMRVIEALTEAGVPVLLTTTTQTSASLAERRLPKGAIHQFAPLDTPAPVRRFLDHWRPDLAVSVESEIWPRLTLRVGQSAAPQVLLNARLSEKSLRNWARVPRTARRLMAGFDKIYAQTPQLAERLGALLGRADHITVTGDLKASARKLPARAPELATLRAQLAGRRIWAAVSTHEGEEEIAVKAHEMLLEEDADALLILAPRHPERGGELAHALRAQGWSLARRSSGEAPRLDTQIYLADTLGELGLWFSLARGALIGASLVERGGHNPFEAVPFALPVIAGPHRANFKAAYAEMASAGAALLLAKSDPAPLHDALLRLWDDESQARLSAASAQFPLGDPALPGEIARDLIALLEGETL